MSELWRFGGGLAVVQTGPEHVAGLEELQRIVFPTLAPEERFEARHYLKHVELFPEGQMCVVELATGRVVGMTSTIRMAFDFDHPNHTFAEVIQGGWLTSHDPRGAWLYGADIGTHPEFRQRGVARALYASRCRLVRRLGLAGQMTVGMPSGFGALRDVPIEAYVDDVAHGRRRDPTISTQLQIGFSMGPIISDYINDPVCAGYGIVLVLPADRDVRYPMTAIRRVTEIPGPKSRAVLERRAAAVTRALAKSTEVVVERAEGALVHDVDGNTLVDLAGGIGMTLAGHCPPSVVAAIDAQSRKLVHSCALVATYEPYVRLCEILNEIAPGDFPKKTLLANSGAEAVENAVKIARAYTKRAGVLCFEGGYHGRTLLTLSLTSKYGLFKQGFGPFAPEIYRIPAPEPYRRPPSMTEEAYVDLCIAQLERALIAQIDPASLAAIIIEPVQGEAGFIAMPHKFLRRIRELCTQHGIVMIADEIQCGIGRTGTMFAIEHAGVVPDLVTTAKALGSGMPISATTGRAEIMDAPHVGGTGGTYGGSPVACAAAIETIEMIRAPAFLAHAKRIGEVMRRELERIQSECKLVGDVRGVGPMLLIELVTDRATKMPAAAHALAVIKRAVANGVVLIRAGLYSNCVRFMPPLVITEEQVLEGLAVVGEAIRHVEANGP